MKNLLIIVFCKIDNKKIEEIGYGQKTFIVALFDFATFGRCISLFALATFGHQAAFEVLETKRKKKMTMIQIRSEKTLCHEKRGVT